MTEAEWLACEDPEPMSNFAYDKVSERKMRLFAVVEFRSGLLMRQAATQCNWLKGLQTGL